MNDTFREYTSYGKVILPLMRVKREITPAEEHWGDKDQYFLFFKAPEKKQNKLVIYLHGGGWNSNSPKQHFFVGQKIALSGYDCAMIGYHKAPKYRYKEISEDVFRGYDKLRGFLNAQGYTYEKIVVSGSSAGAHLGAILCFDEVRKEKYGIAKNEFAGLLSMAGPLSFDRPQTGSINSLLKGLFGTKDPEVWKTGEPIRMLTEMPGMKVFLIQSKHDGLVGYEQAVDFVKKAESFGMETKLSEVTEKWDTHSLYCVGSCLLDTERSETLKKAMEVIEEI